MPLYYANVIFTDSECPTQRHLTDQEDRGTRSIPPLVDSVTATRFSSGYPPEEVFAYSYPFTFYSWCAGFEADLPNITITMTEPVVLHGLLSGGHQSSTISMQYVTAFSLSYEKTDGSDTVSHQLHSDTTVRTYSQVWFWIIVIAIICLFFAGIQCSRCRHLLLGSAATAHSGKDTPLPCPRLSEFRLIRSMLDTGSLWLHTDWRFVLHYIFPLFIDHHEGSAVNV